MPESNRHPDPLEPLLKSWQMDTALPSGFPQRVWQRIRREPAPAEAWRAWLVQPVALVAAMLRRPLGAMAYLFVLVAVGLAVGYWSSEHYARDTRAAWRVAYVRSVTPEAGAPP